MTFKELAAAIAAKGKNFEGFQGGGPGQQRVEVHCQVGPHQFVIDHAPENGAPEAIQLCGQIRRAFDRPEDANLINEWAALIA